MAVKLSPRAPPASMANRSGGGDLTPPWIAVVGVRALLERGVVRDTGNRMLAGLEGRGASVGRKGARRSRARGRLSPGSGGWMLTVTSTWLRNTGVADDHSVPGSLPGQPPTGPSAPAPAVPPRQPPAGTRPGPRRGSRRSRLAALAVRERAVRPDRLVHHREGVRGSASAAGITARSTRSPGRSPQRRGRDRDVRPGRHGDHAAGVAAGDDHARGGREGQPVARMPAQRAGDRAVGHPAGLVDPAEAVAHVSSGTAGITGTAATGRRRAAPVLPGPRTARRPDGQTGG